MWRSGPWDSAQGCGPAAQVGRARGEALADLGAVFGQERIDIGKRRQRDERGRHRSQGLWRNTPLKLRRRGGASREHEADNIEGQTAHETWLAYGARRVQRACQGACLC